ERAAYVVKGKIEIADEIYKRGQMIVFNASENPRLKALEQTTIMLLGGEPLGERFIWWNFVSSSKERIDQAKADWKAGRIKLPPLDDAEFIPLPENKMKPASSKTTPPPEPLS